MRVWVQAVRSSKNIRVCKFRLEFLSYIKKKKFEVEFSLAILLKKGFNLILMDVILIKSRDKPFIYDPIGQVAT